MSNRKLLQALVPNCQELPIVDAWTRNFLVEPFPLPTTTCLVPWFTKYVLL